MGLFRGKTLLEYYDVTIEELTELVERNGSLRSPIYGYVAEYKLRRWLEDRGIEYIGKSDDHDRKNKGDLIVRYREQDFVLESKSLQTESVRGVSDPATKDAHWFGTFQCDASDKRTIKLANGHSVTTTSLQYGEFDVVAVNLFAFGGEWSFVFALNEDLLWSDDKKIKDPVDRTYLIKTTQPVCWPQKPPFTDDPKPLLDAIIERRKTSPARIFCVDTSREIVRITPHPLLIRERKRRAIPARPRKKKAATPEPLFPDVKQ
jgi:hypothetical protein